MTRSTFAQRDVVVAGLGAGIAGALALAAYAALVQTWAGEPLDAFYVYLAGIAGGPGVAQSSAAIPVGAATLLVATIPWAFGYVHLARQQAQLVTRPVISGICFGALVYLCMQIFLAFVQRFTPLTTYAVYRDLIGCMFLFGPALAWTAAHLLRTR